MSLKHKKVLGVNVTISTGGEVLEYIRKYLENTGNTKSEIRIKRIKPLIIFTPNPEIIVYAQKQTEFKQIVNSAQINIPDGAGVVWALQKLYNLKISRLAGTDLMEKICRLAADKRFTVGVIGGRGGVALEALECLQRYRKNLKIEDLGEPEVELRITNYESGDLNQESGIKNQESGEITNGERYTKKSYDSVIAIYNSKTNKKIEKDFYFKNLVKKIIKSKIDILFLGFGFPKQENFIHILNSRFLIHNSSRPLIMMSVGGAFDYISGRVPRAPEWMRDRGWEWMFRLMREPWRLKRQFAGTKFFLRIAKSAILK